MASKIHKNPFNDYVENLKKLFPTLAYSEIFKVALTNWKQSHSPRYFIFIDFTKFETYSLEEIFSKMVIYEDASIAYEVAAARLQEILGEESEETDPKIRYHELKLLAEQEGIENVSIIEK